ncbi:MAG: T9SS type A sorting domain-containing protein, partial [Saprospiraceae bacterium]|nr:T9SS type A sorting domain-containing protein [Saprospiraceae bacterium]
VECPPQAIIECVEDIVPNPSAVQASDNCGIAGVSAGIPVLISGNGVCTGSVYELIYTVTDICGQQADCVQTFVVENQPPVVDCGPPIPVECAADIDFDPYNIFVAGNCGGNFTVDVSGPVVSSYPDCPGTTHTFTLTVTDACGLSSTCEKVFVIQNAAPQIVCPPDMTVECASDIVVDELLTTVVSSCDQWASIDPVGPFLILGQENCSGAVYAVDYNLEDACGRTATCRQFWNIQNEAPTILSAPQDMTVECSYDAVPRPEEFFATSPCGLSFSVVASEPVPLDNFGTCPGAQYQIQYSVVDECGRITPHTQTYTIDNPPPRVYPPDPKEVICWEDIDADFTSCHYESSCYIPIVATELIGPIHDTSEVICHGSIVNYLYTVWDACGRMTCEAQVFTFNLENTLTLNDTTVLCSDIPDQAYLQGCVPGTLKMLEVNVPLADNDFRLDRTYTVTDECGNSFIFEQSITVLCDAPPAPKEYCTYTDIDWGDPEIFLEIVSGQSNPLVSIENPMILGDVNSSALLITDQACVETILTGFGALKKLPDGMGTVQFTGADCNPEPFLYNDDGSIANRMISKTIALDMNCRLDPDLGNVYLALLCGGIPASVWEIIGENGRIEDLLGAANGGLTGEHTNLYDIAYAITIVNRYFDGCRLAPCDESEASGGASSGNVVTNPWSVSGSNPFGFDLAAFPNPTKDIINIKIGTNSEMNLRIELFASDGRLLYREGFEKVINQQGFELEMEDMTPGLYFLRASNQNGEVRSLRIVKQ